jgi:hypothetical protein
MGAPLDDDPELAAALGRMVGAWSNLEYLWTLQFAKFTGMELNMAAGVFDFFKSTRTQCDVLRRLGKISPQSSDEIREGLKIALKLYQELADRRNMLAHNPFGWTTGDEPELYIMEKTKGVPWPDGIPFRRTPIKVEDLNDLRDDIQVLMRTMIVVGMIPPKVEPAPPLDGLLPHIHQSPDL